MNFLEEILEYKKAEVEQQKISGMTQAELENEIKNLPSVNSFLSKLGKNNKKNRLSLIAEVKKASPSKGLIRQDFDPVSIALEYQNSNATAISVLTDEKFFQGSINYLKQVRKSVKLPLLRKDFVIDPYQIYQTRAMGADIILLIVSTLDFSILKDFYNLSKSVGLEVLMEVHDHAEMELALETGAQIIGINNRNLSTFEISLSTTINIIKDFQPYNRYIISESGICSNSDVTKLKNAGVSGILVGESLMRQKDIEKAVVNLMGNC